MLKTLAACLLALLAVTCSYANDYDDAWKAIRKKDFKSAENLLLNATKNSSTALDAYLTLVFLHTYTGNENQLQGLADQIVQSPDKNAYLYALWFNGAMLGQYSKKKDYQLDLLNKLLNDRSINGSIQSAAHYVKAMHYVFSNDHNKAKQEWASMGAIQDWALTGPFENLSGSGFNNQYGPLADADTKAIFKGMDNADVS